VKILVNSIPLTTLQTGIGRYVRNLYGAMEAVAGGGIRYFSGIRADGGIPRGSSPRFSMRTIDALWKLPDPAVFTLRVLHWLAYEAMLRRACGRERFDVYHETGFVPAEIRDVPVVYNIYDLSLLKYREKHPKERVWFFDHFFRRRFPAVAHVLTISSFVKSEIVDEFRMDPDRVSAIPLAPDPVFSPRRKEETDLVLRERGWPDEYLLFVGSLEPRKNLSLLMEALVMTGEKIPVILTGWQPGATRSGSNGRGGSVSGTGSILRGTSMTKPWRGSTAAPRDSFIRACMKVSDCPFSRRWPAAPR
jgi:alpha-1,3-rhamnosyl/mannosyltransferase